ncbi:helix-turn-helix domain-containing protein [Solidesulfovibrio sp.]
MTNIKKFMEAQSITVRELARMTGLSNESIMRARDQRIESCSLRTLATIAAAMNMKVKDLFTED